MTFDQRVTAVRIDGEWPVLGETYERGRRLDDGSWDTVPIESVGIVFALPYFRFEYTADGDEITGPVSAIQALKLRPEA